LTNRSIPTADFERDRQATEATRDTISRYLLIELATLPIGSSSGGFVYRLNRSLGTVERASESFGGFFVERSLTAGRRQASVGMTYEFADFDSLDERDLEDTFLTTANKFRDEPAPFDVETLLLRISTRTLTLFGNFGVTDRLDIGAALPVVDLDISGERVDNYRGESLLQARASASASGVADLALRARLQLVRRGGVGLTAATDVRLPTGRKENLLGSGRAAVKVFAIASVERGRLASHVNAGVTARGLSDEINYGGAVTIAATPRVTVVLETLGRRLEGLGRITEVAAPHPEFAGVDTIRLLPDGRRVNTVLAVVGVKWNLGRSWLLNGNVLAPLTTGGLRTRYVPAIALDYAFGG
jgi:hypothetical protein